MLPPKKDGVFACASRDGFPGRGKCGGKRSISAVGLERLLAALKGGRATIKGPRSRRPWQERNAVERRFSWVSDSTELSGVYGKAIKAARVFPFNRQNDSAIGPQLVCGDIQMTF